MQYKEPVEDLDLLIEYFNGPYLQRREQFRVAVRNASELKDKGGALTLGYTVIEILEEIGPWITFCGEILDKKRGDQINISHNTEAKKRKTAEVVKSEAAIFIAPFKRAHEELKDFKDTLTKSISWSQSQLKVVATEEYGDLFAANNEIPEEMFTSAPKTSINLKKANQ